MSLSRKARIERLERLERLRKAPAKVVPNEARQEPDSLKLHRLVAALRLALARLDGKL
jgi:hypothetical protein